MPFTEDEMSIEALRKENITAVKELILVGLNH